MKRVRLGRSGRVALVDDEDYERLAAMSWQVFRGKHHRTEYAKCASGPLKSKLMHRIILGFPSYKVDHRDGDGLNNQRSNLRPATDRLNQLNARVRKDNTLGYKGVRHFRYRYRESWDAQIKVNGKWTHLGTFTTAEEAARA